MMSNDAKSLSACVVTTIVPSVSYERKIPRYELGPARVFLRLRVTGKYHLGLMQRISYTLMRVCSPGDVFSQATRTIYYPYFSPCGWEIDCGLVAVVPGEFHKKTLDAFALAVRDRGYISRSSLNFLFWVANLLEFLAHNEFSLVCSWFSNPVAFVQTWSHRWFPFLSCAAELPLSEVCWE